MKAVMNPTSQGNNGKKSIVAVAIVTVAVLIESGMRKGYKFKFKRGDREVSLEPGNRDSFNNSQIR